MAGDPPTQQISWFWRVVGVLLRYLKVILRWFYGTNELERILGRAFYARMPYVLELYIGRSQQLKSLRAGMRSPSLDVNSMYQRIVQLKGLNTGTAFHTDYVGKNLKKCLKMMQSYNALVRDMKEEAIKKFDEKNKDHTALLFQLWTSMDPLSVHSTLSNAEQAIEFECENSTSFQPSLVDSAWELLGFQGEKPWTDFRATGFLGLKQLLYFAGKRPTESQKILAYCMQHGQLKCFSYAITGISITYDVMKWFRQGDMKLLYYKRLCAHGKTEWSGLDAMHWMYCIAFMKFQQLWASNPPETVMEYSKIHKQYVENMKFVLADDESLNRILE